MLRWSDGELDNDILGYDVSWGGIGDVSSVKQFLYLPLLHSTPTLHSTNNQHNTTEHKIVSYDTTQSQTYLPRFLFVLFILSATLTLGCE